LTDFYDKDAPPKKFVQEQCEPYELPNGRWTNVKEFWFRRERDIFTIGYGLDSRDVNILALILPLGMQSAHEKIVEIVKSVMEELYGGPVPYDILFNLRNGFIGCVGRGSVGGWL
jgi:hypothetical protein